MFRKFRKLHLSRNTVISVLGGLAGSIILVRLIWVIVLRYPLVVFGFVLTGIVMYLLLYPIPGITQFHKQEVVRMLINVAFVSFLYYGIVMSNWTSMTIFILTTLLTNGVSILIRYNFFLPRNT